MERIKVPPAALKHIEQCDTLLFTVTSGEKSIGMGIEAGYAKATEKKILLAKKSGVEIDFLESLADKTVVFEADQPSLEDLRNLLNQRYDKPTAALRRA